MIRSRARDVANAAATAGVALGLLAILMAFVPVPRGWASASASPTPYVCPEWTVFRSQVEDLGIRASVGISRESYQERLGDLVLAQRDLPHGCIDAMAYAALAELQWVLILWDQRNGLGRDLRWSEILNALDVGPVMRFGYPDPSLIP